MTVFCFNNVNYVPPLLSHPLKPWSVTRITTSGCPGPTFCISRVVISRSRVSQSYFIRIKLSLHRMTLSQWIMVSRNENAGFHLNRCLKVSYIIFVISPELPHRNWVRVSIEPKLVYLKTITAYPGFHCMTRVTNSLLLCIISTYLISNKALNLRQPLSFSGSSFGNAVPLIPVVFKQEIVISPPLFLDLNVINNKLISSSYLSLLINPFTRSQSETSSSPSADISLLLRLSRALEIYQVASFQALFTAHTTKKYIK